MQARAQALPAANPVPFSVTALQEYFRANASPTTSLPPIAEIRPRISWAGPLAKASPAASTLPSGKVIPVNSSLLGGPLRDRYAAALPGQPALDGYPCLVIQRRYRSKGSERTGLSATVLRMKTNAPVVELAGVVVDGGAASTTLVVDGELIPPKVLSSGVQNGGWNFGAIRIDFGSRKLRDIWIETSANLAYVQIGPSDEILPVDDSDEPQLTAVGDSYLQARSGSFGAGGAIALELAARLGIRKVVVDAIGGTGYRNSNGGLGSLNDRLPAHVADNSAIYLVMAGINDYADIVDSRTLDWGTRSAYEASVRSYLEGLRAAQPGALIVCTAPFCPVPSLADASYVANPAVNTSGLGDNLYKAMVHKNSILQVSPPWVYIDVLMGGGWLNSSGRTGDVTNLQWFTGGTPAPGTTATYRPGNTHGGGGGGFGGIASIPVLSGGRYTQAPDITVCGGTGAGLLLASTIDRAGALTAIHIANPGYGYTSGPGLPNINIDRTYQLAPAALGEPRLIIGINPNGAYPLPEFAPPDATAEDLNNIYVLLGADTTHPSPVGVRHLSTRLARNIHDAVMAL